MKENRYRAAVLRWACILLASSFIAISFPGMPATGISLSDTGQNQAPPQTSDFDPAAEIESIILSIDEGLMAKHIQSLQDFGTRYSYRGDRCYEVADHIKSVFDTNGLDTYYDDFTYNSWKMRNVVGVKPGSSGSTGTVIICGHYDTISPGSYPWTAAPGADDNGSGTAAVMAAAEILSDYEFDLNIKFIAFSGEELGLKGSFNYRNGALATGENITGVINLDMIANNPDPGSALVKLYTGSGTIVQPTNLFNAINVTTSNFGHLFRLSTFPAGTSGSSDHQPFAAFYESVFFHEYKFSSVYHTTQDTIDRLNLTYCANVTQFAVATLANVAGIRAGDRSPPVHTPGTPGNGSYATAAPEISIEFTDPGGIDAGSVSFTLNGMPVSPVLKAVPLGYNMSYTPPVPFSDGTPVEVSVSAADLLGNNASHNWSFTIDAEPPEPPSGLVISASRISLAKRGTVLDIGSPADIKHAVAPSVIHHDGEYKMWYMASNASRYHINYANSTDGLTWVKHGTVLLYSVLGQPDSLHVGYPSVIYDGEYKMWYSANNGTAWQIMYATSSDGMAWTKHGVVMGPGAPGGLDSLNILTSTVLKTHEYKMWYTGIDGLKHSIMYANSTDGITWAKHNNSLISPEGPGTRWGDAGLQYPEVIFDGSTYRMWYNRIGSNYYRTHYAESTDGLEWNDLGLAIDGGVDIGTRDRFQATLCSALVMENETKVWYSGFDSANWRILFANITPQDAARDLTLSWAHSPSPDVVRYEIFRESRPSAFRHPLRAVTPESHSPPAGLTPWTFQKMREVNITAYGPVTGSDPPFFTLPDDNILDLGLCIIAGSGAWLELIQGTDFTLDAALGHVTITSSQFGAGCTVHAWYNHTAGRALRVYGDSVADIGANDGMDYYYVIRAVDRAGNYAYCADLPGKIGAQLSSSWNLVGNPFLADSALIEDVLAGIDWTAARTWEPARWPNPWTINRPGRPEGMNTLQTVNAASGVWVQANAAGAFAAYGLASNVSVNLTAGWNLVCYPFLESMSVSQALTGVPWDRVEVCDSSSPTLLKLLSGNDILMPGQGLWVRVTSDAVWNAINVP